MTTQSIVAVTGASGLVGIPAIDFLLRKGEHLRVLTSSPASAEKLKARGVQETLLGDFRNDADLDHLMDGATTLVHIPPAVAEDEHLIGLRAIAAAQKARLEHFVFVSCYHSLIRELRHHHNKLLVEQTLATSGLTYSVLQPAMFMQNLNYIWTKIEQGIFEWPWDPTRRYTMCRHPRSWRGNCPGSQRSTPARRHLRTLQSFAARIAEQQLGTVAA
ncbi:SDR family oxidoreductase [Pseudomonas sp. LB3P14]